MTAPSGATIGDTLRDEEGILYADIEIDQCVEPKQFHDVSGGYNRFDIFQLTVDRSANRPVTFVSGHPTTPPGEHRQTEAPNYSVHDEE